MEMRGEIKGLEAALKNLEEAFPKQAEEQRRLLNRAMAGSARKSMLPLAKSLALVGDGSGALSESLALRATSKGAAMRKGAAASMQITPVRDNKKAIAKYIAFYKKNSNMGTKELLSGIRHGHLIEFGTARTAAYPYLYPAMAQGKSAYISIFAGILENRIAAKVRSNARRNQRKRAKR